MDKNIEKALESLSDWRFILLEGKVPVENDWTGENNYSKDDRELVDWILGDGNYGVLCQGNHMVIDCDTEELTEVVKTYLPDTFTVSSQSEGCYHFYYKCEEDLESAYRLDKIEEGDTTNIGDIQGGPQGKQVVGPGSSTEKGTYTIVNDKDPETIEIDKVLGVLSSYVMAKTVKAKDDIQGELEKKGISSQIDIEELIDISEFHRRAKPSEYEGPHPIHGSSTGKNLVVNTDKDCWICFRHDSGGGPLHWLAVEEEIIECQEAEPGALKDSDRFKEVLEVAKERDLIDETQSVEELLDEELEVSSERLIHPVIDYTEDIGTTFGAPLQKSGRVLELGEEFGIKTVTGSDNHIDNPSVTVKKQKIFGLGNETREDILRVARRGLEGSIDLEKLYSEVKEKIEYYWYHSDERWYDVIACWTIGTYFHRLFDLYPPLRVQGVRKSGKTTVLLVIRTLTWNPTNLETNLRPAPLFRRIEGARPTFFADVTEITGEKRHELCDLVESGRERGGTITRCVGEDNEPTVFKVFCPKAIASRADLPFDPKSIKITSSTPPSDELKRQYTERRNDLPTKNVDGIKELREELIRASLQKWKLVKRAFESEIRQTEDLIGRTFREWSPVLAVCKAFAPGRYDDVLALAEEYARTRTETDRINEIENLVIGILLTESESTEEESISLLLKEMTSKVRENYAGDINWQPVKSAIENLGVLDGSYTTSEGKKYTFAIEKVEKKAEEREIQMDKGPNDSMYYKETREKTGDTIQEELQNELKSKRDEENEV